MSGEYRPASDPLNGPNRLVLDRTSEARAYDRTDWPGSASFHPPHLEKLFEKMLDKSVEQPQEQVYQPELPFES